MSTEANKALIQRWFQMCNAGEDEKMGEIYASDIVYYNAMPPPAEVKGLPALQEMFAGYRRAFPEMKATIEEQVAEGDRVVTRGTMRAVHRGPMGEIAPTNREITLKFLTIDRIANGKIVEEWEHFDTFGFMKQLGAIQETAEQAE